MKCYKIFRYSEKKRFPQEMVNEIHTTWHYFHTIKNWPEYFSLDVLMKDFTHVRLRPGGFPNNFAFMLSWARTIAEANKFFNFWSV